MSHTIYRLRAFLKLPVYGSRPPTHDESATMAVCAHEYWRYSASYCSSPRRLSGRFFLPIMCRATERRASSSSTSATSVFSWSHCSSASICFSPFPPPRLRRFSSRPGFPSPASLRRSSSAHSSQTPSATSSDSAADTSRDIPLPHCIKKCNRLPNDTTHSFCPLSFCIPPSRRFQTRLLSSPWPSWAYGFGCCFSRFFSEPSSTKVCSPTAPPAHSNTFFRIVARYSVPFSLLLCARLASNQGPFEYQSNAL